VLEVVEDEGGAGDVAILRLGQVRGALASTAMTSSRYQ